MAVYALSDMLLQIRFKLLQSLTQEILSNSYQQHRVPLALRHLLDHAIPREPYVSIRAYM